MPHSRLESDSRLSVGVTLLKLQAYDFMSANDEI